MKIVLSSRGSRGDVNPLIEIAARLKQRGHTVRLCVPRYFEGYAGKRELDVPYTYSEDSELLMRGFGSGWKSMNQALKWFSSAIEEQFKYLLDETKDADILVTSANELAVPSVAEYRNIPHCRIAFAPILPGDQPPPLVPWQRLPRWGNRSMWKFVNLSTGLFIKRYLNKRRLKLKMGYIGPVADYFTEKCHTILAINRTLAPESPSWKKYSYSYSGYCYGDIFGDIDKDLLDFINGGPKPIYIGFGSVNLKDPDRFTRLFIGAANKAGCRIVLGTGWTGLGREDLPEHVYPVKACRHGSLFPLMKAVIHHGGSGTTHTAALAGVPQFIMPQIADQFYWGERIYRLGLGPEPITPKKINIEKLSGIMTQLATYTDYEENASKLSEQIEEEDAIDKIISIIEKSAPFRRIP